METRRRTVHEGLARARSARAGTAHDEIQADIVPLGGHDSAGAALWVTRGQHLVQSMPLTRAPLTPDEACDVIALAVERASRGTRASRIAVRHERTADALRARFPQMDVVATPALAALDALAAATGPPPGPQRAFVGADARLSAPTRDHLLAAAMACYQALPWRWIEPAQLVLAQPASAAAPADAWWISFGGGARSVPSVTLARSRADLDAELRGREPDAVTPLVSITFLIADDGGVSTLVAVRGCPGGALDAEEVAGLALAVRNAARFAARHQATFRGEPGSSFPVSDARDLDGLRLTCRGYCDLDDASPLKSGGVSWGSPPDWRTWLTGLEAWLGGRGLSADEVSWHRADAECLADFAEAAGIAPAGLHEADLRRFLYDQIPRQHAAVADEALATAASLALLFEMAAATMGLRAMWIHPLLFDRDTLIRRCRGYANAHDPGALREWEHELGDQLARRVMVLPPDLARAAGPARVAGADRDWLAWREELVEGGATNPSSVRAALTRLVRAAL